ncbi:hypothetical protein MGAD_31050 [Mycolicibacterium gadium]|jgi:hypothetical protein|uniref:DUF559 domain-containing protein n=2 Tax=Mycolicibacterium gadium TaxID=1794 RepID=A0A7I7WNV8_MYCGU|nr:hypothetical protein MGAD_31050 [Mycolicibacterium gadium]
MAAVIVSGSVRSILPMTELMTQLRWPFIGAEALAGRAIPERALRRQYQPLYPGVYLPHDVEPTARVRAEAAWLWSKRRGVVAGLSAASMLGTKWISGRLPAELIHDNRRPPRLLTVRADVLAAGEVARVRGIAVTTAARTAFDIGRHTVNETVAVMRVDALMNRTSLDVEAIRAVAEEHHRVRGLPRLRAVLSLVDGGAESPQETVARLALIRANLPRPTTQVEIFDEFGQFIARVDMAYEEVKVAIEYDGEQHWADPAVRQADIDKMYELNRLGWIVIRVSSDQLRYRRTTYTMRVEKALLERGLRW